jgi:hypothetical protein
MGPSPGVRTIPVLEDYQGAISPQVNRYTNEATGDVEQSARPTVPLILEDAVTARSFNLAIRIPIKSFLADSPCYFNYIL